MIAELVPLDQTRVGLDLIEKGEKKGIEKGADTTRRAIVQRLFALGDSVERISDIVQLPVADVRKILEESQ